MFEGLPPYTENLIGKVGREGVRQGSEFCTYHLAIQNWKPMELLPPPLKRSVEIGQSTLDPKIRPQPEGFSYSANVLGQCFKVSFVVENPSVNVRIFRAPEINENELFYDDFTPHIKRMKEAVKHLEPYRRGRGKFPQRLHTGEIRPVSNFEPTSEVPFEPLITDIMLEKFTFWRSYNPQATTGSDLHRCILTMAGFSNEVKEAMARMINPFFTDLPKPGSGNHRLVFTGEEWKLEPIKPPTDEENAKLLLLIEELGDTLNT